MRFLLDENVPAAVARMLGEEGHDAEYIRDYVPPGSPDPLVATIAQHLEAVLVTFDGDFQKIAPRLPDGQKKRFKTLCRIWIREDEPKAAERIRYSLPFVVTEYETAANARDQRMMLQIGRSFLRTDR